MNTLWVLAIIINGINGLEISSGKTFKTMDSCFETRDMLVEKMGRPIVNYQVVCVRTNGNKRI